MATLREYHARMDNGHEYFDFEFISSHRANSKQNKKDCMLQYRKLHGYNNWNKHVYVVDTYRI